MKLSVSKHQLLSTLCVVVACAAALLTAGATAASAKILGTAKAGTSCVGEDGVCSATQLCCPGLTCMKGTGGDSSRCTN